MEKLKGLLRTISLFVIKQLEREAVKAALIKFLQSASTGGVRAWIITYLVKDIFFDKAILPVVQEALLVVGLQLDTFAGGFTVRKMNDAWNEGDQDGYDSASDDIIN